MGEAMRAFRLLGENCGLSWVDAWQGFKCADGSGVVHLTDGGIEHCPHCRKARERMESAYREHGPVVVSKAAR